MAVELGATEAEQAYLEFVGRRESALLDTDRPLLMAFRPASMTEWGTEIMFLIQGDSAIDWEAFPIEDWLEEGVPESATSADAEVVEVGGEAAIVQRLFDSAAGVGLKPSGGWVTMLLFNSGAHNYSATSTTGEKPTPRLEAELIELATSVETRDG